MTQPTTTSPAETSSIGAIWPPAPTNNERIRGFYAADVISADSVAIAEFGELYRSQREELAVHPEASRLSIRAVMEEPAISLASDHVPIEAAVPLGGDRTGLWVVYMGENQSDRIVPDSIMRDHSRSLLQATERPQEQAPTPGQLAERGLISDIIRPALHTHTISEDLIDEFTVLYAAFGYNRADVAAILTDPNNTIAFLRSEANGLIVSSAMAERGSVTVHGLGQVILTEITEAITRPDQRGRGLYRTISGQLIANLLAASNDGTVPTHAIYGEGNLAKPRVLGAAHQNGRRFSYFDGAHLGLNSSSFGILPQNFSVVDGTEERQYNDFAVSYIPMD